MSSGAKWVRAALQVNPYTYEGRSAPKTFFNSESEYNTALLDTCDELDITMIAITDHWCVDSARGLVEAATERGIVALPGFEANSSEGIHILVLFEAGTPFSTVNAAIGRCGADPGCDNGTPGESYAVIMEQMTAAGALPIPAHVNTEPSGLLTTRSGQPLAAMIQHEDLHAIGVSPNVKVAKDQEAIVSGTGIFERVHPLAVIHADDVMGPRQLQDPGASSWFKVSKPSLESLKLAVRTPQTRVSLTDPSTDSRPRITNVSWTGGYLDGVKIPISADLTALIGGRGAGKSTVIESIRYALNLHPISDQMSKDHQSIVESVLKVGTVVSVEVENVSPIVQNFTIQREVPHEPFVIDSSGEQTSLAPSDVIGAVEIFGQHELAELTSDSESIAELVKRFDGSDSEEPALADIRQQLLENRGSLRDAESIKAGLEEEQARAERLEEQLDHYKDTDVPGKLKGHQRLTLDEAVFKEGTKRLSAARSFLEGFSKSSSITDLSAQIDNIVGAPQAAHLTRVSTALQNLQETLSGLNKQAVTALEAAEQEVKAAEESWLVATSEEKESYGEILRDLAEQGLDPGKYITAKQNLTELRASQPKLIAQDETIKELQQTREGLLKKLREHEELEAEHMRDAIRSANAATKGVVVVRPIPAPDRTHIIDLIQSRVSGHRTQIVAAVQEPTFIPHEFAAAIREGTDALEAYAIKGAQATNLIKVGEELAREIEELTVGLAVEVLLKVDGAQKLRSIDQLSKGQRATALLLLLLGASDAPLIIDQPEDDLDNNFVYNGVVKNLRELKGKRQIITSTHNANVPVLGDAELIIVLESNGNNGRPSESGIGSLDDRNIRSLAENILEGGPAAFNARHHLYGF